MCDDFRVCADVNPRYVLSRYLKGCMAIEIIIDNSMSQIKGLTTGPFNQLRKVLSYYDNPKAAYYKGGFNRPKYLIDKKGHFPTGLQHRVEAWLNLNSINYSLRDTRVRPIPYEALFKPIWPNALYKAQEEAVLATRYYPRGVVSMPTGTGKSYVIMKLVAMLGVRTLIVVPTLEIKKQLVADFISVFGSLDNITIENIDSSTLKTMSHFDCLIIDEAHHVAAKTYQKLNTTAWEGVYHRYFFTATPFRNNPNETLLFEGIAGEVIYQLSYKRAIKDKLIVPIEAYYINLPKQETNAYTWAEVYSQLVVNNKYRNKVIASLLGNLWCADSYTLTLVKEITHGENIAKLIPVAFANGQDDETRFFIEQFKTGNLKSLIGTTGILGEGVDTKPCEYVIIAGLGKAKSAFMQQIGRAVRKYPGKESAKIILFRDAAHKFTLRHYNMQAKILKEEYGITPTRLDIA